MQVTNIISVSDRKSLYEWFMDNKGKVGEFWVRVNRSAKPVDDSISGAVITIVPNK